MSAKRLIVTADDFGLSSEINAGIVQAYSAGCVTAAALLVNGMATPEAVSLARSLPGLEVGLHLSIVEGYALSGGPSTICDAVAYFDGAPCLIRNWQSFIPRYLLGRISLDELARELELQFQRFADYFGAIPFVNGTQHLHVLPGIAEIVLRLCRRYKVPSIRIPGLSPALDGLSLGRLAPALVLQTLGQRLRRAAPDLHLADYFAGFPVSGSLSLAYLERLLPRLPVGTTELMCHPGYDCKLLRERLSGYRSFGWENELGALCSPKTRSLLNELGIELVRFSD